MNQREIFLPAKTGVGGKNENVEERARCRDTLCL